MSFSIESCVPPSYCVPGAFGVINSGQWPCLCYPGQADPSILDGDTFFYCSGGATEDLCYVLRCPWTLVCRSARCLAGYYSVFQITLDSRWGRCHGQHSPARLELSPYMIISHTHLLPPAIMFSRSWPPFPAGWSLVVQESQGQRCVCSCCAAAHSYQHWVLLAKVLGQARVYVSLHLPIFKIFPNFYNLFSSQHFHHLWAPFFFPRPCLLFRNPSFSPKPLFFPV